MLIAVVHGAWFALSRLDAFFMTA